MADPLKAGDRVRRSGIYSVVHEGKHADAHEVTCVAGTRLPSCRTCGEDVRFVLVRHAKDVTRHELFAP